MNDSTLMTRTSLRSSSTRTRQSGAALAISLVFLLILTILGISAATNSTLEEKMSGNVRDLAVSGQLAESALRSAGDWIRTQSVSGTPPLESLSPATGEIYVLGAAGGGDLAAQTASWWMNAANAIEFGIAGTKDFVTTAAGVYYQASEDPRFVIEGMGFLADSLDPGSVGGRNFYRTSGYGNGLTTNAQTLIQGSTPARFN